MNRPLFVGLLLMIAVALGAVPMRSIEFKNQDLRDILLALGELNGVSIVPDETVEGRGSYVFSNMEFDTALSAFLETFHLTATKSGTIYQVSRVSFRPTTSGRGSVDAIDVPLRSLLRALSQQTKRTILFDALPNDAVTLHVEDSSLEEIVAIAMARFGDYLIDKQDKYLYVRNRQQASTTARSGAVGLSRTGDTYALKVDKGRFRDLLLGLFALEGKEVVLLMDRDSDIQSLTLKDKSFDEMLKALLLQGNADVSFRDGVYYVVEVQRRDLLKQYLTNVVIPLENITSADLQKLLPSALSSPALKIDEKGNRVVLTGMMEEIRPIWDFLKQVDIPTQGVLPTRVDLSYLKTDEFIPLLPPDLSSLNPIPLPGKQSLLIAASDDKKALLNDFVRLVDRPTGGTPIRLRYLKSDDLMARLPPSAPEGAITRSTDQSLIFYRGTPDQRRAFLKDLLEIDRPRPQIQYKLLVLQLQEGVGLNMKSEASFNRTKAGDLSALAGSFGSLMSLDFDVVSTFGATFGLTLSAGLANSEAKVVADTTLNGLSGEKLSFQNTNTSRYRTTESSTTNGNTTSVSVVRELTSGLLITIEGWISSDEMITLKIDSTLSKEVTTDSLPSTSEKKLNSVVRTPSGQPVIISGLKQEDTSFSIDKVPVLGDIPLLGYLFQKRVESVERTDFAIYIVPQLERTSRDSVPEEQRLEEFYRRLAATL